MRAARPLLLTVLLAIVPAAAAMAHTQENPASVEEDTSYQWGEQNSPTFSAAMSGIPNPSEPEGPCTEYAKRTMPANEGHDHTDIAQHRFRCEMEQKAFHAMTEQFEARPDVIFGEMDIKGDLAAVAIAYPESGFVLFDVSDTSNPKFLSWYRGDECEGLAIDVDCGAFVDLSPSGKRVYVSIQQISVVPGGAPSPRPALLAYPGVDVVDISDRESPSLIQKMPVESIGGVHTTRSFEVPGKGEYTVSVANGVGATFHKVDPESGTIENVGTIAMDELHDTFIQQDPKTGKTLLYIAGGFDSGFYVYDVSDPENPVGLAEWDVTPECEQDWYAHTIDVTTINGRRIVTLPVELIDFFGEQGDQDDPPYLGVYPQRTPQNEDDQGQGCGKLAGNGDFAGPLFIVDATDFSKMGAIDPTDSEGAEEASDMKARSQDALITVWSNAAHRAGGELTFSPHNQQIVGDKIFLSGYHSGVTVLDAEEAFEGKNVRPRELGVIVPHGDTTRPIHPDRGGTPAYPRFFTSFIDYRPSIWDMQWHRGHVLAADMVGGFYSIRYTGEERIPRNDPDPFGGAAPQQQGPRPSSGRRALKLRLIRNRLKGRRLRIDVRGTGLGQVRAVTFRINGRRVGVDRRRPFRVTLNLGRQARRSLRLSARVTLRTGRKLTLRRELRTRLRQR
ncbi:MAG TPA: hypothetical protein VHF89_01050 [Solirubrobacteraceae bacterium]|nr:hypothetical protein [Solirubrobacteraceae bacterium]